MFLPGRPAASSPSAWKPALRAIISLAVLSGVAWKVDWSQVAAAFAELRWGQWLVAVGIYVIAQVLSALRWQWLSRPLGFNRPFRAYVGDYFVGMFFNLLLPTSVGGDAVRAMTLNAGSGRKLAAVLSVLLDRLSGLLVLLALACIAAAICQTPLPDWIRWSVAATGGGAVIGLAALPFIVSRLAKIRGEQAIVARLRRLALMCLDAWTVFRRRRGVAIAALALSTLIQLSGIIQVAVIGAALGAKVPWTVYGVAVPMVALLTLLPVSLNGMGVREAGMALFLAPAGIEPSVAVTIAFLWFCSQTVAGLAGGIFYLMGRSRRTEVCHDIAFCHHSDQGRAGQCRSAA